MGGRSGASVTIFRVPVTITTPGIPGGPYMNVWNCRTIGPGPDDSDQLSEALDALEDFYRGVRDYLPNLTEVRMGEGMIRDPLGSPEYQADDPRSITTGGVAAGSATALLAIVVSWRTSSASRSGRGRTFVGPFSVSATAGDGTPNDIVVNGVRAAAEGLVDASTGPGGWAWGVLSTKQGILRDFTGSSVRDRWSFLSSRRG